VFLLLDKLRMVSNVEPQFLYDLSDREIEEQVNLCLACKWLAGLQPEEVALTITYCADSAFRRAQGREIIQRAREAGLVHGRLRTIDATHLQAEADLFRLLEPPLDTPAAQALGSSDPDARFERKSQKKSFYSHKEHFAMLTDECGNLYDDSQVMVVHSD